MNKKDNIKAQIVADVRADVKAKSLAMLDEMNEDIKSSKKHFIFILSMILINSNLFFTYVRERNVFMFTFIGFTLIFCFKSVVNLWDSCISTAITKGKTEALVEVIDDMK